MSPSGTPPGIIACLYCHGSHFARRECRPSVVTLSQCTDDFITQTKRAPLPLSVSHLI